MLIMLKKWNEKKRKKRNEFEMSKSKYIFLIFFFPLFFSLFRIQTILSRAKGNNGYAT